MSFFSDLFEGNFGNLGTDLEHAPSSFAAHPAEIGETAAAIVAALSLGTLAPEAFGAAGAAEAGLGAEAALGGGEAALGAEAAAGGGDLATALGIGDIGTGLVGAEALGTVPADTLAFLPEIGADLGGGALGFAPDVAGGLADAGFSADTALESLAPFSASDSFLPDTSALAGLESDVSGFNIPGATFDTGAALPPSATINDIGGGAASTTAATTPAGFASTDAELLGGVTGTGGGGGGGFGGITSTLGNVLSSPWTRLGLGAAPLALALFRGEPGLPSGAQQAQQNAAVLSQFGQQQLAMGQAGQLNAGQMAFIAKNRADLTNAYRQALYNQGVQNPEADTRWPQMLAEIDTQVTAMTATMIQQEITNGLNALGASSATLNQIAQMQMQADQNFTNTLVNATKALGLAAGSGLIKTTTTTTQAAA